MQPTKNYLGIVFIICGSVNGTVNFSTVLFKLLCILGSIWFGRARSRALFLLMIFLEKTLRDWKVTLDPMADRKPVQLKVASEAEARATPAPTTSVISCWA